MGSKYGKIKTADELEKAILSVKANQKALGTGISKDAQYLLDSIKPANLVNDFVSNFVPATTLTDAGIGLVQGVKKIFTIPDKSKEKWAEKKAKRKAKKDAAGDTGWEAKDTAAEEPAEVAAETVPEEAAAPEPETRDD